MDHQLQPQLGHLMLDDEQHLVVIWRIRQRYLRRQQRRQLQIAAVTEPVTQIGGDALFKRALVVGRAHAQVNGRGRAVVTLH